MDYGSRFADKSQRIIEWRLQRLYREAQRDLEAKFDAFLEKHKKKGQEMWQKLQDGEITLKEYQNWMRGQVFQNKQWQAKINQAAESLKHVNEEALAIVRGEQFNTFAENANYEAYEIEKEFRGAYNFNIYDTDAVQNLVQKKPELLPRKTVNGQKDEAWNKRVIANCVAQGIIQGESIDKIARRIARDTASTDMKSMVRYARTATTSAMNAGKLQTMERAQNMGLRIQKQWRANLNSRTRDAHRDLDGQIQDLDDPFESDLGAIMYPGDPAAAPGNVYNCRCRLRRFYPEYPDTGKRQAYDEWVDEDGEKHRTPYYVPGDMTYREWEKMKRAGRAAADGEVDIRAIARQNELETVKELAEKYGISGDVKDPAVSAKIADALITESGYHLPKSRWNGKVKPLDRALGNDGEYDSETNTIFLDEKSWFETAIHENLHSRSACITRRDYIRNRRIEEACVETLTRSISSRLDVYHRTEHDTDVTALRQIAEWTKQEPGELAAFLLNVRAGQRYNVLMKMINQYASSDDADQLAVGLLRQQARYLKGK